MVPRNREWLCCFGLHVRTVTIIIGLWHLLLNILAFCLLVVIWRNPQIMEELENSYDYTVDMNAPVLPTPLSKVEPPYAYRDHSLNYQNFDMGSLVCTCMIAVTSMMIYGAMKRKPSHLLPFFCLQLFDFAITILTAAGYFCYLQSVHRLIAESRRLPWREKLLELSPDALMMVVVVSFLCIVFLKAYTIGVVWRCYKYLTIHLQNLRNILPCGISQLPDANIGPSDRPYSTLLPNYDEAIAQYVKHTPPPSYQVAMLVFGSNHVGQDIVRAGNDTDSYNSMSNNSSARDINTNNILDYRRSNEWNATNEGVCRQDTVARNIEAIEIPPHNITDLNDAGEENNRGVLETRRCIINTTDDSATGGGVAVASSSA